jgi:hypothetical protein
MKERTENPASPVPTSGACGFWEILLADALDGVLRPEDEAAFHEHIAICPSCAALYEAARKGREWLEFLAPEPDVPAGLLTKLLEHTGPGQTASQRLTTGSGNALPISPIPVPLLIPVWQRPGLAATLRRFTEPRLLMTAAMAFFSIAFTLSLTGVPLRNIRLTTLRPNAVRSFMERRLTMASTPIVRYYDHLRLVNEVEARVRELRRNTRGESQDDGVQRKQKNAVPATPGESKRSQHQKDGGSRVESPQQSQSPLHVYSTESLEASLTYQDQVKLSSDSVMVVRKRGTVWTV